MTRRQVFSYFSDLYTMEWIKKKSFADYLQEENQRPTSTSTYIDATPAFVFFLQSPSFKKICKYDVSPLSIEERIERYLSCLSQEAKAAWLLIDSVAKAHHLLAMPWDSKSLFRKLALRLHPDHSKDPNAHQKFLELKRAYDLYSAAIASACI